MSRWYRQPSTGRISSVPVYRNNNRRNRIVETGEQYGIYSIIIENGDQYLAHIVSSTYFRRCICLPVVQLSEEEKDSWFQSLQDGCPTNPLTGRVIDRNGPTAAMLFILCNRSSSRSSRRNTRPHVVIQEEENIILPMAAALPIVEEVVVQPVPPTNEEIYMPRTAADFYRNHTVRRTIYL
jgi:hypothetical protein